VVIDALDKEARDGGSSKVTVELEQCKSAFLLACNGRGHVRIAYEYRTGW